MSLPFPNIDPVALQLGPLPIRWYSLAYIGGLAAGWWYLTRLLKNSSLWPDKNAPITRVLLDDVIFWVAIGVMAGGRLGYVLFYEPSMLLASWTEAPLFGRIPFPPALMLWHGGMSFHGGLIGVTLAGFFFGRKYKLNALSLGDLFACAAPIGLFFGRIANFINAELYGRPWDGAWAMEFPIKNAAGEIVDYTVARHPSQLYEAALEGVVLFVAIRIATHSFGLFETAGRNDRPVSCWLCGVTYLRGKLPRARRPYAGFSPWADHGHDLVPADAGAWPLDDMAHPDEY